MKTVGIICEYNPLHLGHAKQLRLIRERYPRDCAIVCLMSGNFVQRGQPAIFDKMTRARAALEAGADLVLELPVTCALSSAEGFARGGVEILGKFCDELCFGCESGSTEALMETAQILLSPEFSKALRTGLDDGLSFPAARQKALELLDANAALLTEPNDILGVEYCKAILSNQTKMTPLVIRRRGSYHAQTPDAENPSATALRSLILSGQTIQAYVPGNAFQNACVHTLELGQRAILARLRTMTEAEFETVPFGSEGLWRKLMHAARGCASLEEIIAAVKSKRYTRTRIDRMILCAFLGITQADLDRPAPYARILGFTEAGRQVLRMAKEATPLHNIGCKVDDPYWELEQRCSDLYGLFAETPEPAGQEARLRVIRY